MDTSIEFMLQLMGENISSRTVYMGPDKRIVENLSHQLIPELFFFRVVPEEEVEAVDNEYYAGYLSSLHGFVQRELDSRGGEFFADEVYRAYYRNNFLSLTTYLVLREQWRTAATAARISEVIIGPEPLIKKDLLDALTMQELYDEAEVEILWFLERYPNVSLLRINYGYNLLGQERYDEAVDEFTRAAKIGDINAEAYLGLGIALSALGRDAEAKEALTEARESINENTSPDDRAKIEVLLDDLSR
jgi:tetratricopeptide (TPR) repeat protein